MQPNLSIRLTCCHFSAIFDNANIKKFKMKNVNKHAFQLTVKNQVFRHMLDVSAFVWAWLTERNLSISCSDNVFFFFTFDYPEIITVTPGSITAYFKEFLIMWFWYFYTYIILARPWNIHFSNHSSKWWITEVTNRSSLWEYVESLGCSVRTSQHYLRI